MATDPGSYAVTRGGPDPAPPPFHTLTLCSLSGRAETCRENQTGAERPKDRRAPYVHTGMRGRKSRWGGGGEFVPPQSEESGGRARKSRLAQESDITRGRRGMGGIWTGTGNFPASLKASCWPCQRSLLPSLPPSLSPFCYLSLNNLIRCKYGFYESMPKRTCPPVLPQSHYD